MTIEFEVPDASCGHCKATIESAVSTLTEASGAEMDLSTKRLRVEGSVSPDDVSRAIEQAGYSPIKVA
ncbi:MAG TPA: heavy metal-associated domain-containing protein [Actinomycetota bacterium]|nr:heavy metal-associated domain-containing protein [Actinomycetota bacterium]